MIDFHTHLYPEMIAHKSIRFTSDFYNIPLSGTGLLEDLLHHMDESGTSHAVTHSVAVRADQIPSINRFLRSVISDRIIGYGAIHPDMAEPEETLKQLQLDGIKGVKIHPDMQKFAINDERMDRIYRCLEELDMPIMIHMGDRRYDTSDPRRLADVMDRFPKLRVIGAHLGGYSQWSIAKECLYGRENLYMDTSSALRFIPVSYARELMNSHDTEKIFFATDYPLMTQKLELVDFEKLKLPDDTAEKILHTNAARFLGLDR